MKKVTVIFLALLISLILCACGDTALCGKWYSSQDENTVIFDQKGGFQLHFWDGDIIKGTYVIANQEERDDSTCYTVTLRDGEGRKQDTVILIDGDEMTMSNGIYKKQ